MGRRLYGVDLDESPFGGLIEGLLTEEELEKLADGGRSDGAGDDGDGRSNGKGRSNGEGRSDGPAGEDSTDTDADRSDDAVDSSGTDADRSDVGDTSADSFTWGDTPAERTGGAGEFGTGDSGIGNDDDAEGDRYDSYGSGDYDASGSGDYGSAGSVEFGATGFEEPEEDDSGGIRSTLSAHRSLILKGTVVLLVLAVVAALVWKYAGTIKGFVPGRGGDDAAASGDTAAGTDSTPGPGPVSSGASDADVSPARRRAKADSASGSGGTGDGSASLEDLADTEPADTEPADTEPADADASDAEDAGEPDVDADTGADERSPTSGPASRGREPSDAVPGPERPGSDEDVDLGALVGLGALALIAAVVRKFGEDRPHDPLVDGPEEE